MKDQKQKPDIKNRTVNNTRNSTQLFRIKDNREETKKMVATIQMVNNSMQKSATVIQRAGDSERKNIVYKYRTYKKMLYYRRSKQNINRYSEGRFYYYSGHILKKYS
jgi:hypothetical protein